MTMQDPVESFVDQVAKTADDSAITTMEFGMRIWITIIFAQMGMWDDWCECRYGVRGHISLKDIQSEVLL